MQDKITETYCDRCGEDFEIDLIDEKLENGIEKISFYCPECKAEYIVSYTNQIIKDKQNRLKKISAKMKRPGKPLVKQRMIKEMFNLKAEIKKEQEDVKRSLS